MLTPTDSHTQPISFLSTLQLEIDHGLLLWRAGAPVSLKLLDSGIASETLSFYYFFIFYLKRVSIALIYLLHSNSIELY